MQIKTKRQLQEKKKTEIKRNMHNRDEITKYNKLISAEERTQNFWAALGNQKHLTNYSFTQTGKKLQYNNSKPENYWKDNNVFWN